MWPTLGALAGIAATLALGNWQLGRGQAKTALAQTIAVASRDAPIELGGGHVSADDVVWRRVEARGRFAPQYGVLIDNRIAHGAVGYYVVMPLKLAGSERYVLVNRGWIAATQARATLPEITTPAQEVTISGMATVPGKRYLELSPQIIEGRVWQNLTLERYRANFPLTLQPVVIQQQSETPDGLVREWSAPDLGVDKHYGYAFQWFAMAAAIFVIYLVCNVRKSV